MFFIFRLDAELFSSLPICSLALVALFDCRVQPPVQTKSTSPRINRRVPWIESGGLSFNRWFKIDWKRFLLNH